MKLNLIKMIPTFQEAAPMQNKIVIFLSSQPQSGESEPRVSWLIKTAEGATQCVLNGRLSELQPGANDEIGVVVSTQNILLTEARMPRLSAYRLQQALPFALEEQVLDDVELLHFAPGPYLARQDGQTEGAQPLLPVAIVKKTLLEQWLALLENQGIQPDWLTPAVFTLPLEAGQWQLLLQDNTATVRTGLYAGFSAELPNLETLLSLKLEEEGRMPEKLVVYQDTKQKLTFPSLNLPTEHSILNAQQELEQAAAALEKNPGLNLLQGPYISKHKLRIPERNKRAWLLAAYAFALWVSLLFVSKLGSWMILSLEHHHLQTVINDTYRAHFPQATSVVDPKGRLEAKLKTALAQSEKNRFFQWLGYLSKAPSSVRLQTLSFQDKQLSLELVAASFASLDDFILALKSQGVEVKQQSAAMAGSQVKAILVIEGRPT